MNKQHVNTDSTASSDGIRLYLLAVKSSSSAQTTAAVKHYLPPQWTLSAAFQYGTNVLNETHKMSHACLPV